MAMPIFLLIIIPFSLNLSQKISLNFAERVRDTNTVLLPLDKVLGVELGMKGLSEYINIDIVVL
jgi:hypothetical protein